MSGFARECWCRNAKRPDRRQTSARKVLRRTTKVARNSKQRWQCRNQIGPYEHGNAIPLFALQEGRARREKDAASLSLVRRSQREDAEKRPEIPFSFCRAPHLVPLIFSAADQRFGDFPSQDWCRGCGLPAQPKFWSLAMDPSVRQWTQRAATNVLFSRSHTEPGYSGLVEIARVQRLLRRSVNRNQGCVRYCELFLTSGAFGTMDQGQFLAPDQRGLHPLQNSIRCRRHPVHRRRTACLV